MPLSTNNNTTISTAVSTNTVDQSATTASSGNNVQQQQQGANFEYTTTNIPAFLSKLWTLVEDPKYDQLIAWDAAGFSFHVFDQTRFAREILPKFFKHNNMASFIRQLNMYGFRKVNSIDHGSLKNEKEDMEFHHPYFMKGKEQFLEFIKRKVPDIKINNQTAANTTSSNQAAMLQYSQIKQEEINKVLDDVNSIKSRQKMVDDSLYNVKKENEALWKEIATLRQKHHHQQQIVNKLIHFLVHLVNPSSLGLKRSRPLMIDSHSVSKFANLDDNDDEFGSGINDLDNEDDDDDDNNMNRHHHADNDAEFTVKTSLNANINNTNNVNRKSMSQATHNVINNIGSIAANNKQPRQNNILNNTNNHHHHHHHHNHNVQNHIVEIEDYDEANLNEVSKAHILGNKIPAMIGVNPASSIRFIEDNGEIETINVSKNVHNNNNGKNIINSSSSGSNLRPAGTGILNVNKNGQNSTNMKPVECIIEECTNDLDVDFPPTTKKFKSLNNNNNMELQQVQYVPIKQQQQQQPQSTQTAINIYHSTDLKNFLQQQASENAKQQQQQHQPVNRNGENFLDANIFLNSPIQQQQSTQADQSSPPTLIKNHASPIVTTPASPLEINTHSPQQTSHNSILITEAPSNSSNANLKNSSYSSNQMNDHVESLQLDLNSIKEFLTQNSFTNTIDPYTLNNLFSPNVLDQIENEPFYIEGPVGDLSLMPIANHTVNQNQHDSVNTAVASIVELNQQQHQPTTASSSANPTTTTVAANNNGKIIGNELIQYEPFNVADFVHLDDLLSPISAADTVSVPVVEPLKEHATPIRQTQQPPVANNLVDVNLPTTSNYLITPIPAATSSSLYQNPIVDNANSSLASSSSSSS